MISARVLLMPCSLTTASRVFVPLNVFIDSVYVDEEQV